MVSGVDFLPSILSLVGIKDVPKGDGTDLSATFKGQSATGRTRPLFWKRPPDRGNAGDEVLPDLAVREGNWKLLVQQDGTRPQLYNLASDAGETKNVAASNAELAQRLTQAVLDWNRTLPPAPKLPSARAFNAATHFDLKKGDTLGRFQAPDVANRGFTLTAKFDAEALGGVIVAQGGVAQGYTLFLDKSGKLNFLLRVDRIATTVASPQPVTGLHTVVVRLGADRSLTLRLDDRIVAQAGAPKLLASQPVDGLDVGRDADGAVGPYEAPFAYAGRIDSVQVDLEPPLD